MLTRRVYETTLTGRFEKDFGLRDQIRRASVSIMANIAEGFDRRTTKEFISFLRYALASSSEVKSHLYVARDLDYLTQPVFDELYNQCSHIAGLITAFIQYLSSDRGNCGSPKA